MAVHPAPVAAVTAGSMPPVRRAACSSFGMEPGPWHEARSALIPGAGNRASGAVEPWTFRVAVGLSNGALWPSPGPGSLA